jgi:hypothetical protein
LSIQITTVPTNRYWDAVRRDVAAAILRRNGIFERIDRAS